MIQITFDFYPYTLKGIEPIVSRPESVTIDIVDVFRKVYKDVFDTNTLHLTFMLDHDRLTNLAPYLSLDYLRSTLVSVTFREGLKVTLNPDIFNGYVAYAKMYKGYKIYSEADYKGNYAKLDVVNVDMLITNICDEDWQTLVG